MNESPHSDLDPEELADLEARLATAEGASASLGGGAELLVVRRGALEVTLPIMAWVIAGISFGLEQPHVALGLAGLALVIVIVREARRVARLRIAADGAISLPGRLEPIDWSRLARLSFAYRYPFSVPERRKAAFETADLQLELDDGRRIKLAKGPLWRLEPTRAPLDYASLERIFLRQARAAGMVIERQSKTAWVARRPAPSSQ